MSTIANLTSATSALPPVNAHGRGHKKSSQLDSIDNSGSTSTAQVPATTQQNLFGSMLQSLEQVIGVQLGATAPATSSTAASTTTGVGTTASAATGSTSAATAATTSAAAASYLRANGSQTQRAAGSTVSVNA
jgi:hypothetical protein